MVVELWLPSCSTVYYDKESRFYSLVYEQPGASGREEHVSLPFLMQQEETYKHCSVTAV